MSSKDDDLYFDVQFWDENHVKSRSVQMKEVSPLIRGAIGSLHKVSGRRPYAVILGWETWACLQAEAHMSPPNGKIRSEFADVGDVPHFRGVQIVVDPTVPHFVRAVPDPDKSWPLYGDHDEEPEVPGNICPNCSLH